MSAVATRLGGDELVVLVRDPLTAPGVMDLGPACWPRSTVEGRPSKSSGKGLTGAPVLMLVLFVADAGALGGPRSMRVEIR